MVAAHDHADFGNVVRPPRFHQAPWSGQPLNLAVVLTSPAYDVGNVVILPVIRIAPEPNDLPCDCEPAPD